MENLKRFFRRKSNIVMTVVLALIILGGVIGAAAVRGSNSTLPKESDVVKQETSDTDMNLEEKETDTVDTDNAVASNLEVDKNQTDTTVDSNVQEEKDLVISSETKKEKPSTTSVPTSSTTTEEKKEDKTEEKPSVTPEETTTPVPEKKTCTISISCEAVLSHMDQLAAGKESCVPTNGCILSSKTLEFSEGETVFDVLVRACKNAGIQLEYSYSPVYGSYYVEGIHNLYEFDCGNSSGWKYKVNGTFPNYGCSSYELSSGDKIVWTFTCGN